MSRTLQCRTAWVALLLSLTRAAQPPNIVMILADDLGWHDVSYHGSDQIPTPNIDVLAMDGVVLANNYVQPLCTPSRAALLTGYYPIHTGTQHSSFRSAQPVGLDPDLKLLPEYLKDLGYSTHMVGKWHLGFSKDEYKPTNRGFDTFYGIYNGEVDYWTHFSRDPFFLYFAPTAVHCGGLNDSLQAPKEYVAKYAYLGDYDRQIFAGSLAELDNAVGAIVEALYKAGLLNNTVIGFSTDNGGAPVGFSRNTSPNWPLRGSKGTVAEGGVRGPGFLWTPRLATRAKATRQLFHITDWLPTFYAAAGGNMKNVPQIDGVNQWQSLTLGAPWPRKEVLYNIDPVWGQSAIRGERFKIMEDRNNTVYPNYEWYDPVGAVAPDHWNTLHEARQACLAAQVLSCFHGKTLETPKELPDAVLTDITIQGGQYCHPSMGPCMYDLENDPWERVNIYRPDHPEYMKLRGRLDELKLTMKSPLVGLPDPRADPLRRDGIWESWQD
ncbi:arylsulfatase B isoform X2 [Rhipicephalus sanguineus]|uniref:arylsulfatase B isoform X2 n=1 Tax=Rhipicephalus sanguineus TaxID=34632 RepID=UPI001893C004|nr:arylsulfatase B isoform X2 [Rhipicephalus sanguineus]